MTLNCQQLRNEREQFDDAFLYTVLFFCSIKEMEQSVLNIKSDLPDELLFGRAGYLYALLIIQQKVCYPVLYIDLIALCHCKVNKFFVI